MIGGLLHCKGYERGAVMAKHGVTFQEREIFMGIPMEKSLHEKLKSHNTSNSTFD
jgi:hypothetical protein